VAFFAAFGCGSVPAGAAWSTGSLALDVVILNSPFGRLLPRVMTSIPLPVSKCKSDF